MAYSQWGEIQQSTTIVRGMREVSTAGHGGIMVSEKFAEKNLSKSALSRASRYGGYYCFEEDCDWAIPILETEVDYRNSKFEDKDFQETLMKTLSLYNADYLIEIGRTPVEPEYTLFKEMILEGELRDCNSPDLIIGAMGSWHTGIKGLIEVTTADKKRYLIEERFEKEYEETRLKLLSKFNIVEELPNLYGITFMGQIFSMTIAPELNYILDSIEEFGAIVDWVSKYEDGTIEFIVEYKHKKYEESIKEALKQLDKTVVFQSFR